MPEEMIRFCNVPDAVGQGRVCQWPDGSIPYALLDSIPGVADKDYLRSIAWSLAEWAKYGKITPYEIQTARMARILATSRKIDGPRGVLGETELPCGLIKYAHMWIDSSDQWDLSWPPVGQGISLWIVVLHELGHALGIGHAPDSVTAIMSPYLQSQLRGLQSWDIQQIQMRYGKAVEVVPTPPIPVPIPKPPDSGGIMDFFKKLALKFARGTIQTYLEETASKTPGIVDDTACKVLLFLIDSFLSGDLDKVQTAQVLREAAEKVEA